MRIAVLGATGRMGAAVIRLIAGSADLALSGAAAEAGHPGLGHDAGAAAGVGVLGVHVTASVTAAVAGADVAIDFSNAAAVGSNLDACLAERCALVMGTTGLSPLHLGLIEQASRRIPIVYGRNMSVGVAVLTELARMATQLLGSEADIEIVEAHHRNKVDAPSGTALQLGEAVAGVLGRRIEDVTARDRFVQRAPRSPGSIGFSSVRAGQIVGDHEVLFALEEETLRLEHRALDRSTFARGALRAARWVAGRTPGLYGMTDVLGLARPQA